MTITFPKSDNGRHLISMQVVILYVQTIKCFFHGIRE